MPTTRAVTGEKRSRTLPLALRSYAHWWQAYKRLWRGSLVRTFVEPILLLLALGYGVGALVDDGGGFDGMTYIAFIGPGLLATAAMTTAVSESTFPVMGAIRWDRTYHAMLATPLRALDVLVGHLLWILTHVLIGATGFFLVLIGFRVVSDWQGVLVVPFAVLVGLAFATPVMAFAATTENNERFALLYRFGVVPMTLFAGAFFPVSQLPEWLQVVARVTPIYHGVELCRAATTATLDWGSDLGHVAYLLAWGVVGFGFARRAFAQRLVF